MKNQIEPSSRQAIDRAGSMESQRQQWDSVAAGWKKWWPTIEKGAQSVSTRMIELADVRPGHRVLDIATGIGEPALLAAIRVGPAGRVVATDLSSHMLFIARERATALGLTNVDFMEVDAGHLDVSDGSFDAILCRWGIMSLPNPSRTLIAIRRMLTAAGSFATAVWEVGPRGRPLASLAAAVAQEVFDGVSTRSEVDSLSGSAKELLQEEMSRADFKDVYAEELAFTLEFSSAEDCIQYLLDVSPDLSATLSGKSILQQSEYRRSLAERLGPYVSADGSVRIQNATICAVGRK